MLPIKTLFATTLLAVASNTLVLAAGQPPEGFRKCMPRCWDKPVLDCGFSGGAVSDTYLALV